MKKWTCAVCGAGNHSDAIECQRCRVPREIKESKYRNQRLLVDGIWFDSKWEYRRWCDLLLQQKAGGIRKLERQVPYEIRWPTSNELICIYQVDADYEIVETGEHVLEDAKGQKRTTAEFRLKKKLIQAAYGITITEVREPKGRRKR